MTDTVAQIRAAFADAGAQGWLHARPVDASTPEVDYLAERPVVAASVYKVVLLVAVARAFDDGTLDPTGRVTINPTACTPGPTGFSSFTDPVTVSWRDLARSMIAVSDNAAADTLLGAVGMAAVDQVITTLGLDCTRIIGGTAELNRRLIHDTGAPTLTEAVAILASNDVVDEPSIYDPAYTTATSPADITSVLAAIWTDRAASPSSCHFMRTVLAQQVWPHRIKSGFPGPDVVVAGKTGTIGRIRNEAAVVAFPGEMPIAVSVFTRSARADAALPAVDAAIGITARIAVSAIRRGS